MDYLMRSIASYVTIERIQSGIKRTSKMGIIIFGRFLKRSGGNMEVTSPLTFEISGEPFLLEKHICLLHDDTGMHFGLTICFKGRG